MVTYHHRRPAVPSRTLDFSRAALILLALAASQASCQAEHLALAAKKGPAALIVCAEKDPLSRRTAVWCRDFLKARGYPVRRKISTKPDKGSGPIWILELYNRCPHARSLGVDTSFLARARADAYILLITKRNGRPTLSIVGRNVVGMRSGVARLVALLIDDGNGLMAPVTKEEREPFFGIRELVISNRGKKFAGTVWADTLWRRWSDERIRRYAEQIWLLGFNSLQTIEGRGFRASTADRAALENIVHKTRVLMRAARDNGLLVTQWIWGQCPYDAKMCWNTPGDRAIMEEEFRWMARTYGSYVDHVYVHVRDPGGCRFGKDCRFCDDYRTPQEIAAFVLKEYRKVNPRVTVTLSTWFNPGFWNGAPGVRFLDETYCPKEIGIALQKWYDPQKAQLVADSGRPVDIWSWYMSDHETTHDMSLCMRRVDRYFSSISEQAGVEIRRISTEICFHGWPQILSAYVSAQKMWSPRRSLDEIEREWCKGMFGHANADAVLAVYRAVENLNHLKRGDASEIPPFEEVFGNPEYNRQFREALELGKKIVLDRRSPPTFTTATDPQALFDYLMRNLSLITILSEAQERVNKAKQAGAERSELERIVREAVQRAEPYKIDIDYPGLVKRLQDSIGSAS